jgi:hypothetical protein
LLAIILVFEKSISDFEKIASLKNWLATISDFENLIASLKNWLATISDFENLIDFEKLASNNF